MSKLVRQLGSIERHLHKNEIIDLATDNVQAIIDSKKYDLLRVYVELKRYETYLHGLIKQLKKAALEKAVMKGSSSFEYDDARINISKRTKWDFSVDEKWSDLDRQIQRLTKERKIREKYLRDSNKVRVITDKETGEIIEEFDLPTEIQYGLTVRL